MKGLGCQEVVLEFHFRNKSRKYVLLFNAILCITHKQCSSLSGHSIESWGPKNKSLDSNSSMEGKERKIPYMTQQCYPQTENAELPTTYINHRKPKELPATSSHKASLFCSHGCADYSFSPHATQASTLAIVPLPILGLAKKVSSVKSKTEAPLVLGVLCPLGDVTVSHQLGHQSFGSAGLIFSASSRWVVALCHRIGRFRKFAQVQLQLPVVSMGSFLLRKLLFDDSDEDEIIRQVLKGSTSQHKRRRYTRRNHLASRNQVASNDDDTMVLERPIGRKAEKTKQKRKDGNNEFREYLTKKLHYIQESNEQNKEALCIKAERVRVDAQRADMEKEMLRLETIKEEERIMTKDTSGMFEKERLYFENLKDQILARQKLE
ncbi:hypothetical protein CMV_029637 [Castanea mollissima]|uniref:No apical meristem-associated C-terminal domain-containing protein n=1 Tax=Castanea mollissima TaxID=60419 RepID=A0A8J4QAU0_9ROSI|nr:hypothetical protein CMV_029637 [Castanea mollissima]